MSKLPSLGLVLAIVLFASAASAQRPYAIPFQLRPVIAPNVARLETTLLLERDRATVVELATFAHRVAETVSVLVRTAYVVDVPTAGAHGAFANPVLGVLYTPEVAPGVRLGTFAAIALPLGQGDGVPSDAAEAQALTQGRLARASLDNAAFATNHATLAIGLACGWLVERFTFQAEVTLLAGFRARSAADAAVENVTMGAWVAYAILDELFVGAAIHHQHFLSTPAAVRASEGARAQTSVTVAVRGRFSVGGSVFFAPGLAYTRGIDGALDGRDAHALTLDLALPF